eukprot:361723-Chlamydomonas_euryale.AAC.2
MPHTSSTRVAAHTALSAPPPPVPSSSSTAPAVQAARMMARRAASLRGACSPAPACTAMRWGHGGPDDGRCCRDVNSGRLDACSRCSDGGHAVFLGDCSCCDVGCGFSDADAAAAGCDAVSGGVVAVAVATGGRFPVRVAASLG